jgi:lysozyme
VSEYQGKISWSEVDSLENKYPVSFVFIRATVGDDRLVGLKIGLAPKKTNSLEGPITITAQRKLSRTGGAFIKTVSLNGRFTSSFRY